ncbi:hypothetical protein KA089_00085 [Candidatus Woesebacteria bacterium]|nr:hypothetical protein [Candidatus Woesebacteria bacterium]
MASVEQNILFLDTETEIDIFRELYSLLQGMMDGQDPVTKKIAFTNHIQASSALEQVQARSFKSSLV